jgi:hypothetical protein
MAAAVLVETAPGPTAAAIAHAADTLAAQHVAALRSALAVGHLGAVLEVATTLRAFIVDVGGAQAMVSFRRAWLGAEDVLDGSPRPRLQGDAP